jgi:hypothetical protein
MNSTKQKIYIVKLYTNGKFREQYQATGIIDASARAVSWYEIYGGLVTIEITTKEYLSQY